MARGDVARSVEIHYRATTTYGLSAFSVPGADAAAIAAAAVVPHRKIRQTTVGRLRASGFEVVASEPPPHHVDVMLPGPITDETYELLNAAFDPPEANPTALEGTQ